MVFKCPECDSDMVTTEHHQMFMVNGGEHYCHSVKTEDPDSPATCLECGWNGQRKDLVEERTRSEKMRRAGYTRRPKGWHKDGDE